MDMDVISIGERVKNLRESKGLSQEGLAQAASMSRNHVNNIEKGLDINVGLKTYKAIADALEEHLSYIIFGQIQAPNTLAHEQLQRALMPGNDRLPLTPDELELIDNWREVPSAEHKKVILKSVVFATGKHLKKGKK